MSGFASLTARGEGGGDGGGEEGFVLQSTDVLNVILDLMASGMNARPSPKRL